MPLFEFTCRSCHAAFEQIVFSSDTPTCPSCQGTDLEKQHSAFAVGGQKQAPRVSAGGCGSCGDPRGPGACGMKN